MKIDRKSGRHVATREVAACTHLREITSDAGEIESRGANHSTTLVLLLCEFRNSRWKLRDIKRFRSTGLFTNDFLCNRKDSTLEVRKLVIQDFRYLPRLNFSTQCQFF